jgi:hypothetical protein
VQKFRLCNLELQKIKMLKKLLTSFVLILIIGNFISNNRSNANDSVTVSCKFKKFLYKDEFETILNNLLNNFWQDNGDWLGDMMGDATTFAPPLLYMLGKDSNLEELIIKATKTVEYEKTLITEIMGKFLIDKESEKFMEAVSGFPALIYGYKFTKRQDFFMN